MAEPNARKSDQEQEEALAISRLEALKQGSRGQAKAPENNDSPQEGPDERLDEEGETENPGEEATESILADKKNRRTGPSKSGQLQDAALTLAKSQLKKQAMVYLLPALGTLLFWLAIIFIVILMLFAFASVYQCAKSKGVSGILWDQIWNDGFTTLLQDSFSGQCGIETDANQDNASTDAAPKPSPAANIPADQDQVFD